MKDEIKEIIELINTNYTDYYIEDFLSGEDVKKLVDCITNLQKEKDKYKNVIDKIKEYCIKEQARIVINNTEEDEFVYTELLQLIDKLLEEIE